MEDNIQVSISRLIHSNLCATGAPNAVAVLAASEPGGLLYAPDCYMEKIVAGPACRGALDLDKLQGKVVGECHQRHRHQEFLKFLRRLDQGFPRNIPLHLIMDNYGTHKHEKVRRCLKPHPRFVPHFVPTNSSWLNLLER